MPSLSISSDPEDLCSILSGVSAADMINQYTTGQIACVALHHRMQVFLVYGSVSRSLPYFSFAFCDHILVHAIQILGTYSMHAKLPQYASI